MCLREASVWKKVDPVLGFEGLFEDADTAPLDCLGTLGDEVGA
jgi:hypothetical protein